MTDEYYLQDARSYTGNLVMWWAKDGHGYTSDVSKAHVYTQAAAMRQNAARCSDIPWPKDYVDKHSKPRVDHQDLNRNVAMNPHLQEIEVTVVGDAGLRYVTGECTDISLCPDRKRCDLYMRCLGLPKC